MAKTRDLRVQSSTPASPVAGVTSTYANPSGILFTVNENGTTYQVGHLLSTTVAMLGQSLQGTGISGYLPVVGPSGQLWGIPLYGRA